MLTNVGTYGPVIFPATQVVSAGANILDDYEEGTFSPSITCATPGNLSVTYNEAPYGIYTKIGDTVTFYIRISTSVFTYTTASGEFRISGLPFAYSGLYNGPITTLIYPWNAPAGYYNNVGVIPTNTYIAFRRTGIIYTTPVSIVDITEFPSGTNIAMGLSGSYKAL